MQKDLEELEAELFQEEDAYVKEVKEKTERKMLTTNFLESKDQSKVSRLGGASLSANVEFKDNGSSNVITKFVDNSSKFLLPITITMLCGTVTYPIAVRIARRIFRLRGFY